ncbi:hypothetical protein BDW69DRAFT_111063 [Aspergillus filifer]
MSCPHKDSDFSKCASLLASIEGHIEANKVYVPDEFRTGMAINRAGASYALFARMVFHTCSFLICLPSISRQHSKEFESSPQSINFRMRWFETAGSNARHLLDTMDEPCEPKTRDIIFLHLPY